MNDQATGVEITTQHELPSGLGPYGAQPLWRGAES